MGFVNNVQTTRKLPINEKQFLEHVFIFRLHIQFKIWSLWSFFLLFESFPLPVPDCLPVCWAQSAVFKTHGSRQVVSVPAPVFDTERHLIFLFTVAVHAECHILFLCCSRRGCFLFFSHIQTTFSGMIGGITRVHVHRWEDTKALLSLQYHLLTGTTSRAFLKVSALAFRNWKLSELLPIWEIKVRFHFISKAGLFVCISANPHLFVVDSCFASCCCNCCPSNLGTFHQFIWSSGGSRIYSWWAHFYYIINPDLPIFIWFYLPHFNNTASILLF